MGSLIPSVRSRIVIEDQEEDQTGNKREEIEQWRARTQTKSAQELLARALQEAHHAVLSKTTYTNGIDEADSFYKPVVSRNKEIHYSNFSTNGLLDLAAAQGDMVKLFSRSQIVRGKETLTYFRTPDLTGRLPLDKIKKMPLVDQSYDLPITDEQCKHIQLETAESLSSLLQTGGYMGRGGQDWWRPSYRMRFSKTKQDELARGRVSFYTPVVQTDPFGNTSSVRMDEYFLLATEATDAVGNTTTAANVRCSRLR